MHPLDVDGCSVGFPGVLLFLAILIVPAIGQNLGEFEPCTSDLECNSFACALSGLTSSQRICCPSYDYVFVGPPTFANVCTMQPVGAACWGRDDLCESLVCLDGICQEAKSDIGERCDEDSDCRNMSCGRERVESDCIQFCDGEKEASSRLDEIPLICCPTGETIDLGEPWGKVCSGQANGSACRSTDELCQDGSICEWNDRCEAPLGRYQDITLTEPTRFLTIKEFIQLISTETDNEFQYKERLEGEDEEEERKRQQAQTIWNDASQFELTRAIREDKRLARKFPFLLCIHSDDEPETERFDPDYLPTSAYKKKRNLFTSIVKAEGELDDGSIPTNENFQNLKGPVEIDGVPITPLYNDGSLYCGHTMLRGRVAQKISCEGCIVQPLLQTTKMGPNVIASAEGLMDAAIALYLDEVNTTILENTNTTRELKEMPSLELISCAGVVSEEDWNSMYAAEKDSYGFVDTTEISNFLLSLAPGWGPDIALSALSENVYWAQSDALGDGEYDEARGFAWFSVLNYTVSEKHCGNFFQEKLIWRSAPGKDHKDFIYTRAYWNNTEVIEEDIYCLLGMLIILAVDNTVCHIEIPPKKEINSGVSGLPTRKYADAASWLTQTGLINETPWTALGLDGKGQTVAISDTGIDTNNCYFWDAENTIGETHRKIVEYNPFADGSDVEWGHGSHTSCIIAGRRATDGTTESDGAADGVAPGAKLAFLDIGTPTGQLATPSDNAILETGRPMAKIHSASWNAPTITYYSTQAKNFDSFMFDNDDFLLVMSAGNNGSGGKVSSIESPANAKNTLTVGASKSFGDNLKDGDLGPAHVAGFSSRGPTTDGRISPDVVAPGSYVLSAGARLELTGECDGTYIPGAGERSDGLLSMEGSSMAAPVVAGTAAVINQYFQEGWYKSGQADPSASLSPSGALVKAILINGAQELKGIDDGNGMMTPSVQFDNNQGFGVISLSHSLYVAGKTDVGINFWDRQVIDDASTKTYNVTIDRSNGCTWPDLSATLVWMEKGAALGCKRCVINDLDLYVTRDNNGGSSLESSGNVETRRTQETPTRFYPNGLNKPDTVNTVERVIIKNVTDGETFTLHVRATNLDEATATFALVATGCFGGIKNTLDTSNSVFASDNSKPVARSDSGGLSTTAIIAIAVPIGVLSLICFALCFDYFAKRKRKRSRKQVGEENEYSGEQNHYDNDYYGESQGTYGEGDGEEHAGEQYDYDQDNINGNGCVEEEGTYYDDGVNGYENNAFGYDEDEEQNPFR